MASRHILFEQNIKKLGGKVVNTSDGKVNIIYPEEWLSHPLKKRKKKR